MRVRATSVTGVFESWDSLISSSTAAVASMVLHHDAFGLADDVAAG